MKDNIITIVIVGIMLFLLWLLYLNPRKETVYVDRVSRDTLTLVHQDTLKINAKGKIVYRNINQYVVMYDSVRDTLKLSFKSEIDTILKQDTCKISYEYPMNVFSVLIKKKPDSIRTITEVHIKEIERAESWYVKPSIFLGGVLLGYVGGRLK